MVFSIFPGFHYYHHSPISEHFHHLWKKPHKHYQLLSIPVIPRSLLQPQETTHLLSVSVYLPTLDILHKWNHVIYDALWLASLT